MKALVLITALFLLAACNTFEGMGKDLQAAGRDLTNAADDNKDKSAQPQPQPVQQPAQQSPY